MIEDYEAALPPGGWPNWVLGNHDQHRLALAARGVAGHVSAQEPPIGVLRVVHEPFQPRPRDPPIRHHAIEVGHVFKLGTKYSKAMGATYLAYNRRLMPISLRDEDRFEGYWALRRDVTRLDTGESVMVRINDRGPITPGRAIDVSNAAERDIQRMHAERNRPAAAFAKHSDGGHTDGAKCFFQQRRMLVRVPIENVAHELRQTREPLRAKFARRLRFVLDRTQFVVNFARGAFVYRANKMRQCHLTPVHFNFHNRVRVHLVKHNQAIAPIAVRLNHFVFVNGATETRQRERGGDEDASEDRADDADPVARLQACLAAHQADGVAALQPAQGRLGRLAHAAGSLPQRDVRRRRGE